MAPKKNTPKVKFGDPVKSIPDALAPRDGKGAPHWIAVAQHVKANPGMWWPVRLDHMSIKGHASAVGRINAASKDTGLDKGKNKAFTEPGFSAASRDGVLYVRYDKPASVHQIASVG